MQFLVICFYTKVLVCKFLTELSTFYAHSLIECCDKKKSGRKRPDCVELESVYPSETSPCSLIASIDLQPEQRKRPDLTALSFLLHTGHSIIRGNTEDAVCPPSEKKFIASSVEFLILKNCEKPRSWNTS